MRQHKKQLHAVEMAAQERGFYGRPAKRSRLPSNVQRPALATAVNGASFPRSNDDVYYRRGMSLDSLGKCSFFWHDKLMPSPCWHSYESRFVSRSC